VALKPRQYAASPGTLLCAYNSRMNNKILSSLPGHSQLRRLVALRGDAGLLAQTTALAVLRRRLAFSVALALFANFV